MSRDRFRNVYSGIKRYEEEKNYEQMANARLWTGFLIRFNGDNPSPTGA